ncbi:MAG TPA: lysine--tRNA ligase [Pyrinomonadaceae bacterium]|nr:lysine--tRNA ligase [Pyrinomonadaceae bacterium]
MSVPTIEENDQTRARQDHLAGLRQLVGNVYPNKFDRTRVVDPQREDTISSVVEKYRAFAPEVIEGQRPAPEPIELANQQLNQVTVRLAGRIASPPRVMGKAAFVHLSDGVARLQIYCKRADFAGVSNEANGGAVDGWELFSLLDHGDFIGAEGYLFITKTGELSIHVKQLQFLSKALLPLPDKMHGINDPEIRQRQRYADLIAGSLKLEREEGDLTPREVFEVRSAIIREFRRILDEHGYVEVETPMLTPLATGAAAKPFKTHHNALDIDLYARIAPELYLKRLLVGGFEKVYELNRNFRNEGVSTRHNPEFTMLEFYWAYADVNQMMDFCESMLRAVVLKVLGHTHLKFGDKELDFGQPFQRMTMREAVTRYAPDKEITDDNLVELFEEHAEANLIQPTLIFDFPKAISPLSKASPANPAVAERFELYIVGMESANGFSELNDPAEQHQRFLDQMTQRERGDEEAMVMDEDYIRALSYGMPPAAGIGIGIDRFAMLVTNKQSIRDVILFPHMRPERTHQFSWMRWMYDELVERSDWAELTETQQAGFLVEKFENWASQSDSPPNRRALFGHSQDDKLNTATRALKLFRESW